MIKNDWLWTIFFFIVYAASDNLGYAAASTMPWVLDEGKNGFSYASNVPLVGTVKLRAGYFRETSNPNVPFKGCLLYLEGLGDSLRNHAPYFNVLSQAGYRVIVFDYMGQGGSEGTMNHTRIIDTYFPSLQISNLAEKVWEKYSATRDKVSGNDCSQSKKIVIGWSTGGLAAYEMANRRWADAVILIAPGISPQKLVGEAAQHPELMLTGAPVITLRTLTRNTYKNEINPHVDQISPDTPAKVPLFAANLLITANASHDWVINNSVKGLVFASGFEDTYINSKSVVQTIQENAPHFKIVTFHGALHELDNEIPEVSLTVQKSTLEFLASLSRSH